MDGAGDLFIADSYPLLHTRILGLQRSQPPVLNFPTLTNVGSTDSADGTQTVQVQNIGNEPLIFTAVSYPADFSEASGDANACTGSTSLSPGQVCDLPIQFTPQNAGSLNESVVLTDNALDVTGAQQSITVTGSVYQSAALTSPMPGTVLLTHPSVTFTWTRGTGVKLYDLWLGSTGAGSYDLYNSGEITSNSVKISGLPTMNGTVYVRLRSYGSAWTYFDYIFNLPSPATLTSPTQGTTLAGFGQTFNWAPATGAASYSLWLGSSVGSGNLFDGYTTASTITANNLPINGGMIYARLWTNFNGDKEYTDSTFTAGGPATLTSPVQGATMAGASQTFTWAAASGATGYTLYLGSTGVGSGNLLDAHTTSTTVTASNLPLNSGTIYARLWSNFNGVWGYTDSTFSAHGPATLTSPAQGATMDGASETFTWAPIAGATSYTLYLGSTGVGSGNLLDAHTTATTVTASNLPLNGGTIYARLWTNVNGTWTHTDYTFTAHRPATLSSPTQGATFTGSSQTFTWAPIAGATSYTLYLGSTGVGSGNLLDAHTTATTVTANHLPVNGKTIYARLWTNVNGAWTHTDYTFTAQ